MIRARRIQPLLSGILGDGIHTVLLLNADGELLGSQTTSRRSQSSSSSSSSSNINLSDLGALLTELVSDYRRAGVELLHNSSSSSSGRTRMLGTTTTSDLQCLLVELDNSDIVGISCALANKHLIAHHHHDSSAAEAGSEEEEAESLFYIAAVGNLSEGLLQGSLKAKVNALAKYVSESFSQLKNHHGRNNVVSSSSNSNSNDDAMMMLKNESGGTTVSVE